MSVGFKSWSYSLLDTYRTCPLRAKFKYIDKLPDPGNEYSARGNEMHDALERVVKFGEPVPDFARHFEPLLDTARANNAITERTYMFDDCWRPTDDHSKAWLRVKQDLVVVNPGEFVLTVDYKSGKKYGNEVKHMAQKSLYSVAASILWPDCEEYIAEMWYLDHNDISTKTFDRATLQMMRAKLDAEVSRMFDDKWFRPRPSAQNCKYCPYGPRAGGQCPVGV